MKRNETKRNRNKTKVQSDICSCAFRSSCARLSEREYVSVKVCPSTNGQWKWRTPTFPVNKAAKEVKKGSGGEKERYVVISRASQAMLWQEDSSHLAWWMFTTTPIFHAPVSDVSPLTLLRLKFQKKLGPNYRLNNGYFLSGPLGLTNICFSLFVAVKVFIHAWFCTLGFLCYWTGSCYCSVSYNCWRKTRACK